MMVIEEIIELILDDFTSKERRQFTYLVHDISYYISKILNFPIFSSGSFAEGMCNFNDIDKMVIIGLFLVTDSEENAKKVESNYGILIIESVDCYPGFARLLVYREPAHYTRDVYHIHNGKKYLNSEKLLKVNMDPLKAQRYSLHGPAINTLDENLDKVFCLPCLSGTKVVNEFLKSVPHAARQRENMFLFVPKSHFASSCPEIEFRWSFSMIETNMVRDFTDKELKLYFICKDIISTYFHCNGDNSRGLCSYFVKTIIFFMRAKYKNDFNTKSTVVMLLSFLQCLKLSLIQRTLPNYFVRDNNMYLGLTEEVIEETLKQIRSIESDPVKYILSCKSFQEYSCKDLISLYNVISSIDDYKMTTEILENVLRERSFQVLFTNMKGKIVTYKDYMDSKIKSRVWSDFQSYSCLYGSTSGDISKTFIYIYNNIKDLFQEHYQLLTINEVLLYFSRFLGLYLTNTVPKQLENTKDNKSGKYYEENKPLDDITAENLLKKSIYIPSVLHEDYSGELALAFYYYLCGNAVKALNLLFIIPPRHSWLNAQAGFIATCLNKNYKDSILSKDKLFDEFLTNTSKIIQLEPNFLHLYLLVRITKNEKYKKEMLALEEKGYLKGDEKKIYDLLQSNLLL